MIGLVATRAIETSATWVQTMQREPDFSKLASILESPLRLFEETLCYFDCVSIGDPLYIGRTVLLTVITVYLNGFYQYC